MALFEPLPNYVWNLSVSIAVENGGQLGELGDIIKPLRDMAFGNDYIADWFAETLGGVTKA